MNIAIYGAGSLGTIMGAYLSQGGEHVDLIDTFEDHVNTLNTHGATIEGTTNFNTPVHAITPDQIDKSYDLILLLTKQTFNHDVLPIIKNILTKDGILLSLQNGVPEEIIQTYIPKENIIAGSVEFGATFKAPGTSELTTDFNTFKKGALQIGELSGDITPRLKALKDVLSSIGDIHLSDNLLGTKWTKLLINSTFSGLSVALNCTYGDILDDDFAYSVALRVMDECLKVGHANGIQFAPMSGFKFNDFDEHTQANELHTLMQASRKLEASMLQDLRKQRQTEIDFINGLVVSVGKEHGIDTPYNQKIVDIVTEASSNHTLPEFEKSLQSFKFSI